jgi:hypothetical protein
MGVMLAMAKDDGKPPMIPIMINRTLTGELYANVNGVASGSVTCYFNEAGDLIAHTLYGDKLVAKLRAVINARGVVIPEQRHNQ